MAAIFIKDLLDLPELVSQGDFALRLTGSAAKSKSLSVQPHHRLPHFFSFLAPMMRLSMTLRIGVSHGKLV